MAITLTVENLKANLERIKMQQSFLHISLMFNADEKERVAECYEELIELYENAIIRNTEVKL